MLQRPTLPTSRPGPSTTKRIEDGGSPIVVDTPEPFGQIDEEFAICKKAVATQHLTLE